MARIICRLTGPDQCNIVAHFAQMSHSRRPDHTTSDHRKFEHSIGTHD
jgi:hypothetical protein